MSVLNPNAGKCVPKIRRIRTFFKQWSLQEPYTLQFTVFAFR